MSTKKAFGCLPDISIFILLCLFGLFLAKVHGADWFRGIYQSSPGRGGSGGTNAVTITNGTGVIVTNTGTNYIITADFGTNATNVAYGNDARFSQTTTRGDIDVRGASALQRLALGGVKGGFLASDGTDPFWMDPTMGFVILSDFVCYISSATSYAMAPWVGTIANSASVGARGGTGAHPGIISLETGSNAAGAAAVNMGNASNGALTFGSGLLYCRFLSKINTVVSDATDTFIIRIGVGNATTAQPTDGAYFQYTHSINGGNWCLINRKGSTDYGTNAMTLAVSGTWTLFEITVAADASSITFSTTPEGGSKTTATYSEAANITTAEVSPFMHIIKSAGTNNRTFHTDYTLIYYRLTAARQ